MHKSDVNRIMREIRQLVLARKDMELVAEGAQVLRADGYVPCVRLIEAGMVVSYCRAYSADGKRRIPVTAAMLPLDHRLAVFHDEIVKLRDTIYAHSDETPNRVSTDPFGDHRYTEGYHPWRPESFDVFIELARSQEMRFCKALTEREELLRASGAPSDSR